MKIHLCPKISIFLSYFKCPKWFTSDGFISDFLCYSFSSSRCNRQCLRVFVASFEFNVIARIEAFYFITMSGKKAMPWTYWWCAFLLVLLAQNHDFYHFGAIHHFSPSKAREWHDEKRKQQSPGFFICLCLQNAASEIPSIFLFRSNQSFFCFEYFVGVKVFVYWHLWHFTDIKWLNFLFIDCFAGILPSFYYCVDSIFDCVAVVWVRMIVW